MRVLPLLSLVSLSSAFLLPSLPSSTSPLSSTRGRALASSASEELSRKEKSKEQVRSLLKGLGELDDGENPTESTGSKRKVCLFDCVVLVCRCLLCPFPPALPSSSVVFLPSHILFSSFSLPITLFHPSAFSSLLLSLPPSLPPVLAGEARGPGGRPPSTERQGQYEVGARDRLLRGRPALERGR